MWDYDLGDKDRDRAGEGEKPGLNATEAKRETRHTAQKRWGVVQEVACL